MTAHGTREVATEAISRGAYDFFTKPLKMTEFQVVVARALERRRLQLQIKALQAAQGSGFEELVGKSESLKRVVEMAQRAAPADVTVLIEGESGTGKEVLARAIHRLSARKDGPLIPVNCAAIPEGLLESELFGHERGAFTGAVRAKPGRFELAREGTIFLDEIGDMPLAMQVKILRALQEREIERVGGTKSIAIDVRVIAATHQNLEHPRRRRASSAPTSSTGSRACACACRPSASASTTSPTSSRICSTGRRGACRGMPATVSTEALRCLWAYPWPGNVRELQHVLEGAMVMSDGVDPARAPAAQRSSAPPRSPPPRRRPCSRARSTRRSRTGSAR